MISFRVSEREFEMLKTMSESEGARSVSDFARLALCGQRTGNGASPDHPAASNERIGDGGLDRLRNDLDELKAYVRRVAEMLEARDATSPRAPLVAVGRPTGRI
jgi:hypothetical protein